MILHNDVMVHDDDGVIVLLNLTDDNFIFKLYGTAGELIQKLAHENMSKDDIEEFVLNSHEQTYKKEVKDFVESFINTLNEYKLLSA